MKVEIDQRNNDRVVIPCNCGGYHFLIAEYINDNDSKDFYFSMVDQSEGLWNRIKKAIMFIIKGGELWYMETGVTEKDLDKIVDLINKYKKT